MSIWNFQTSFLMSMRTILQNFVKLACLEVAFPKIRISGQTNPDMSIFYWFRAPLWILTSGKNVMVILFMISEISGGWTPPQIALSSLKRQMPLAVKECGKSHLKSKKRISQLIVRHLHNLRSFLYRQTLNSAHNTLPKIFIGDIWYFAYPWRYESLIMPNYTAVATNHTFFR